MGRRRLRQDIRDPQSRDRRIARHGRRGRRRGHRPRGRRGAPRLRGPVEQGQAVSSGRTLLLKLADLVEKNFEELSQLDTLDMGAPISRTRGNRLRVLGMLRYYAGQATAIHGETIENSLPGEIFSYTLKEPVGVVGAIIPGTARSAASDLEDRPGARDRLHRGAEAGRGGAADLAAARRALRWRPAFRPASSTSCRATARPRARRWPRIRTSTRSPSPARTSPASRSSRPRPAT